MADTPASHSPSRSSTPNTSGRFTTQAPTAEELFKEQTVGLVQLSDFRKRRAEALDQVSRDSTPAASGTTTPDGREPAAVTAFKKRRKKGLKTGGLSFSNDDDHNAEEQDTVPRNVSTITGLGTKNPESQSVDQEDIAEIAVKKRLKPSTAVSFAPKAHTKSALRREAQLKDALRKEYAQIQEAVRQTEFCLPFVFFDGKDTPGGMCRMKKGDLVWLFLERARKVGAEKAAVSRDGRMKDWARISVDDLMVVRGDIIVPHHYDFHHFILNRTTGYNKTPIFSYSSSPTTATPQHLLPSSSPNANNSASGSNPPTQSNGTSASPNDASPYLTTASSRQAAAATANESRIPDSALEGFSDPAAGTKVVDRRWYERNKHIYPASLWEEFDPDKDYSSGAPRTDGTGNAYFFSR